MRTKNELYQEALRTIAARRQTARALAEDARAEAEAVIPALRHAEEEVRVRGIRCALAGASGKDRTAANAALTEAKQKLAALLAASGRPADALEPKFTCKKCQDTGVVDGRTCSCVHKVMQALRRKRARKSRGQNTVRGLSHENGTEGIKKALKPFLRACACQIPSRQAPYNALSHRVVRSRIQWQIFRRASWEPSSPGG